MSENSRAKKKEDEWMII